MKREVMRDDLAELRSAGLKAFMEKYGVPWGRAPGRTNNERRDTLWARLAGDGEETATVDAAWWAAARAMASKDPPSKFEELAQAERRRLARTATPGRRVDQDGAGPSRTPGTPGTPGQASGTSAERSPAPLSAGVKSRFSMDGEAMAAPRSDGEGVAAAIDLAELAEGWQTAGKGLRAAKKPKRVALASPIVEQTPPQRRERGEHGAGGAASEVGAASAHGADQAPLDRGSTEAALRKALSVLETARACFDDILASNPGGMAAGLRERALESRDAMETLCAGMALQLLRNATAENKRAAQDLARARKELEKEKKGAQGPRGGRPGRTWAEVAGRPGPDQRAREPLGWDAARTFFLHPSEAAWLTQSFELAAFEDALHAIVAGVPGAEEDGLRPIRTTVRTGRGAVRVEVAPAVAALLSDLAARGARVAVPGFGDWRVERQRPGAAPSLVAMGVSPSMGDEEVAQRLLAGSRGLVPEHLRGDLGSLRAARLHSKRRAAVGGGRGRARREQREKAGEARGEVVTQFRRGLYGCTWRGRFWSIF